MHLLECSQGRGKRAHPVNQKQSAQSRAEHFSSGAQVSLALVSQVANIITVL